MLLSNETISSKYDIVVLTNEQYKNVFDVFRGKIEIKACQDDIGVLAAIAQAVKCCIHYKIKYVFPLRPFAFLKIFGITPVSWIADFQHCHYPDFFKEEEIRKRNADFRQIARAGTPLILSSNDALKDFKNYYSQDRKNVYVAHFVSYIEDELKRLSCLNEREILESYGVSRGNYAIICNQFWKHKNHIIVLEAIKLLKLSNWDAEFQFVFTGELSDRRNPEYIDAIKELLEDASVKASVKVLGFINRASQLCLIKNAAFLIQPSLFEGWSTVVEDGKALNKRMILSDIAVHQEQKNENCILFQKDNAKDLARAVKETFLKSEEPLKTNTSLARQYSMVFEDVFK